MLIFKILLILILFLLIEYISYITTEKHRLPEFINHKPFSCRTCSQFWYNISVATVFMLYTHWYIPTIIWYILTVLETIALKIDQKEKTVG